MAGDDFYTVALQLAEQRDPIFTANDELARLRRGKSCLAHVGLDIEQLENPLKRLRSELFLLPSRTFDNASIDLLDLRFEDGKLVNPFAFESAAGQSHVESVSAVAVTVKTPRPSPPVIWTIPCQGRVGAGPRQ